MKSMQKYKSNNELICSLNQAFICTEGAVRDNFFDRIIDSISNGKVVVFEQLPDKQQSIDTYMKVFSLNAAENFLEDPLILFESPLLLFTLYQLECKFGKKWVWIEQLLNSNPLFRCYRLNMRIIFKLSTYLHILAGERVIFNYKQSLPHERITNLSFFPNENNNSKKRTTVGRKKKEKNNEKEEQMFSQFIEKIEKEKLRLPFQLMPDEESRLGSIFFNKIKYLAEKKGDRMKRFKPSNQRNNSKPKDMKLGDITDPFLVNAQANEKQKPQTITNFAKHLGKSK